MHKDQKNMVIAAVVVVVVGVAAFVAGQSQGLQGYLNFNAIKTPIVANVNWFNYNNKIVSPIASPVTSIVVSKVTSKVDSIVVSPGGPSLVASYVTSNVPSAVTSPVVSGVPYSSAPDKTTNRTGILKAHVTPDQPVESYPKFTLAVIKAAAKADLAMYPQKYQLSATQKLSIINLYKSLHPSMFGGLKALKGLAQPKVIQPTIKAVRN